MLRVKDMLSATDHQLVTEMPVNPEALAKRYLTENYPVYKDFCSFFVSGVVGIRHFDRSKCHLEISKYVSVSDEAFTVLTLENNWARWTSMAENDDWKESDIPSEWTTSKDRRKLHNKRDEMDSDSLDSGDNPQARRYRGWTAKGIQRYNQIFHEVKAERLKLIYREFEEYCIQEFKEEAEAQGKNQNKRKTREPDKPLPVACHELWDEDNVEDDVNDLGGTSRLPPGLGGLIGV